MSKQLAHHYTINVGDNSVTIPRYINQERFLLITDVTTGENIYSFADSSIGIANWSFDEATEATTIVLAADFGTYNVTSESKLQIFYDKAGPTEFEPSDSILDPVHKMRVSNPENLIDTDFEYGLQPTKWETLETSNNIPSFYTGDGDVPLSGIMSVTTVEGSEVVTVYTSDDHGLAQGTPIDIQGVSSRSAEGKFLIASTTANTFTYKSKAAQNYTGNIGGIYTTITPGAFYHESGIPFDVASGLQSDEQEPSKITITTPARHGFVEGSSFYLVNTVGTKATKITDVTTSSAADGNPYIDFENIATTTTTNDATLTETRQVRSRHFLKFNASSVDISANTITWPNHGFRANDCLLYDPPVGDSPIGGLSRFKVYYVIIVDSNTIRLTPTSGGTAVDFISAGTYNFGRSSLHLVYEVRRIYIPYNSYYSQFFHVANEAGGIGSGWDLRANTPLGGNTSLLTLMPFTTNTNSEYYYANRYVQWPTAWWIGGSPNWGFGIESDSAPMKYNFIEDFSRWSTQNWVTTTSYWSTQTYGLYWYNKYRYDGTYSFNPPASTVFLIPLVYDEEGESIYIEDHGLRSGDTVTYTGAASGSAIQTHIPVTTYNANASVSNLPTGNYVIDVISKDRFKLRGRQLYSVNGVQNFTYVGEKKTANSFYLPDHGYVSNQQLLISASDGGVLPTTTTGNVTPIVNPNTVNALPQTFNVIDDAIQTYFSDNSITPFNMTTYGSTSATNTLVFGNGGLPNILSSYNLTTGSNYAVYSNTGSNVAANLNYFNPAVMNSTSATNIFTGTTYENRYHMAMQTDWSPNASIPYYLLVRSTDFNSATEQYYNVFQDNIQWNSISNYRYLATYSNTTYAVPGGASYKYAAVANNFYYGTQRVTQYRLKFTKLGDTTNWYNSTANMIPITSTNNNTYTYTYFNTYYQGRTVELTLLFAVDGDATFDNTSWMPPFTQSILAAYDTNMIYPSLNNGDSINVSLVSNDRFRVTKGGVSVDLTNSGTQPITFTTAAQLGVVDGIYQTSGVGDTSIEIQTNAAINGQTAAIDASAINASVIPLVSGTHSFRSGTAVIYDNGGNADIAELTNGNTYYVVVIDDEHISVSDNASDASNGAGGISLTAGTGTHTFRSTSLAGVVPAQGTVAVTAGSNIIKGTDTLFKRYFKVGDTIYVKDNTATPGGMSRFTVTAIAEDSTLTVDQPLTFTSASTLHFVETKVYTRPDGYSLHRPFDGGVEIAAGTAPLSRITRQTRKYFRYQSGKGIQTSLAINFNPPVILDTISATGTLVTCTTKYPHRMSDGQLIEISGASDESYNVQQTITVVDDSTFTITLDNAPSVSNPSGIIQYNLRGYSDAYVRAGMFDDQNGFFYEYNGQTLYACRRSSTTQLSGTVTVVKGSGIITGTNTNFRGQLSVGDQIVVRGMSYKVVHIDGTSTINVQPQYRGLSASGVIITKTETVRVPQEEWNEDVCDGTGPEGFLLNLDKIQMAYMDYSWYGAGKLRFGLKDRNGHVRYVHSFLHNNRLDEAYMRSGNLPAKYEIENGSNPTYAPTLFHWGTSVIMDGRFDDDKAYLFTAPSKSLSFSNGDTLTATTNAAGAITYQYNYAERRYDWYLRLSFISAEGSKFYTGLKLYTSNNELNGQEVAYTQYSGGNVYVYIFLSTSRNQPNSYPNVPSSTQVTLGSAASSAGNINLGTTTIPLVSLRLSPSVDTNLSGALGARDIINRMQLQLNEVGLILSHDCEVKLILNGDLSNVNWQSVKNPSLSQLIEHEQGDLISGGTEVFSFRASGGTIDNTGKRGTLATNFALGEIIDMGNSILGGDGTYPNGPDVLTVAVKVVDTGGIKSTNPFSTSARITWSESQA